MGRGSWFVPNHGPRRAPSVALCRRRRGASRGLDAQELQVSLQVAEGATNREAAATLFVTPKTIETHLNHVYRKLGVRSRVELAAYLSHTATRT
jgi:DNA-binding CsgD family transcriptional regulator